MFRISGLKHETWMCVTVPKKQSLQKHIYSRSFGLNSKETQIVLSPYVIPLYLKVKYLV